MNIVLWIIAVALALVFLAAGAKKLAQPKDQLTTSGMEAVENLPAGAIKAIGALEVLAAVGLVVPAVLDVATVLVPLAATGLALLMVGAAITHARRKENQAVVVNGVLLVLAAVVAWGRFGPHSF
ncbi:putative membrane protein YphA (DoxX/SURF4 family) [Nocardioides marinisabuli]|uniref:Putative membrane protein YphA (DoxX/SURF4 family) n=1 Tax=Nocardioides marinisabuli TaxID=419476 RepID=A0A7Y9F2V5_9ACTN|nr:DoxX family protein [Nocardioides marinisabuli]NYD58617.1 putative membrane protein YphA (DoxX/SURF4 family) [Nocardioides marinisabuli]